MCMCMYIYIYIYIHTHAGTCGGPQSIADLLLSVEIATNERACGRFPKFHHVLLGRDPGTLK